MGSSTEPLWDSKDGRVDRRGAELQFRDLGKQYQELKPRIDDAVMRTMASAQYIGGTMVSDLEKGLATYVGTTHCITCANGTDALQLALMAWGIGAGDAVIVPDFTFFSSGEVVSAVGATPIFVGVDRSSFNIDPDQIEPACVLAREHGLEPKVIVSVDLFGLPADYPKIKAICERLGLLILEDGAQGFGGSIQGGMACSFGDISTTSFFPAKPLGCYGDGGAVFTDDDAWASLVRSFAVHGKGSMKYDNVRVGMNSRLDALQAAILNVKLQAFADHELDAVNQVAELYASQLSLLGVQQEARLPQVPEGFHSSWAQYTVQLVDGLDRDVLRSRLREMDVPSMVYYPKPMHEQKAFAGRSYATDACAETGTLCDSVLSLPIGPYMPEADVVQVCERFASCLRQADQ